MKLKYRFLKIGICFTLLILMLNFSIERFEKSPINSFRIAIPDETELGFINENNIKESFGQLFPAQENTIIEQLSVKQIEKELKKNPYADSVNVFLDQNKNLNFYILQKEPIIRVNTGREVYYLTANEEELPISNQFSLPTLMVEGNVKKEEHSSLIALYSLINEDKLLKKHIVGVKKLKDNSFILLVNVDDFVIELGDLTRMEEKFKNLKAFYQQYLNHVGWDQYQQISVKYKNQIVATKK